MKDGIILAHLDPARRQRVKASLAWNSAVLAGPAVTSLIGAVFLERIEALILVGFSLALILAGGIRNIVSWLLVDLAQVRSGWVSHWATGPTLHLGFHKRDMVLLSNIKHLGYAYLRNGKESLWNIHLKTGPHKTITTTDYIEPTQEIMSRIADMVGLKRNPDAQHRHAGRWTYVS